MTNLRKTLFTSLLLTPAALAQGGHFLFTTSTNEQTLSGSGGTSLQALRPNEIASLEFGSAPCTVLSAEKWAPRTVFHTQAGDTDADDNYFEANLFGRIDGLLTGVGGTATGGMPSQRTVYYSVSQAMGTAVSGGPGLRPGDIGRIVRNGLGDGQIEYFLQAEDLQIALGLPPVPVVIDVDACAFSPNIGVLVSLDTDIVCNLLTGGPTMVRDGDVLLIPAPVIAWGPNMTVAGTMPGSALVVHNEAQMDAFVVNAGVADRNGVCVNQILDTESLEIDWNSPGMFPMTTGYGIVAWVPHLLFSGESLTGASVLTTDLGGQIANAMCGQLGTPCGMGPTMGTQMGLRPPTAAQGVASWVNALCSTRVFRFVTESPTPQIPALSAPVIQLASPSVNNWMFLTFVPGGPGAVAPSAPFPWGFLGYPDFYPAPMFAGIAATPTGFGTWTGPVIPFPCDLVFQSITITPWGTVEASTPTTIEVF